MAHVVQSGGTICLGRTAAVPSAEASAGACATHGRRKVDAVDAETQTDADAATGNDSAAPAKDDEATGARHNARALSPSPYPPAVDYLCQHHVMDTIDDAMRVLGKVRPADARAWLA
eukprot:gene37254-18777_t